MALDGLQRLGVDLWIDDFGAGYANLNYLQRLSCKAVKIDRSFLAMHDHRRELLGGMINLARACGLRVVVEGIETDQDDRLVKELGCDLLQGYFLGRPMTADALRKTFGAVVAAAD